MDTVKTKALVLRRTNYGEADRILSILTPGGQKSVMAKGVRKEKSKLSGGIELFSVSDLVLRKGKGELWLLTGARLVDFYGEIMKSLDAMEFVGGVLKEAGRKAEQVGDSEYFELVWQVFKGVNEVLKNGNVEKLLTIRLWWGLNEMRVSGEEVNLRTDVVGEKLMVDEKYIWDGMERAMRKERSGGIKAEHIKLMRLMASSKLELVLKVVGGEELARDVTQVVGQK